MRLISSSSPVYDGKHMIFFERISAVGTFVNSCIVSIVFKEG